ncbi:TRAP transporter substrate-binding protein [Ideonella livida]|uniref:TRAP transporter substrate-binding protein n=1 Tax=Ideonella livida TaxID=2707176 RepID=A0A7C9TNY1_9BURK|nr:TRAP transporter substrate-binding protein [Ideonella livida]NDY94085.1 TRAP transporter substrate-binding protein [Ideonella livida]
MKRLMLKTLVAAAAVVATGLLPGVASAQEKTFKFALQNPKGHPLEMGATKFAELVAAKSGGRLKVNVFAGGTLGGDAANVSALQGGTIDFVQLNSGILASQVKAFEVYDLPFLFANAAEADAVVDGPFGQKMHAMLGEKGIVGLAYVELGFRNITNSKKPIKAVDDVAGLKLRVIPNKINIDWVSALGANPTPLAFPEVYAALEQKAIDGQENPLSVILANKLFEVQKHLAVTNHQYNPQSLIMSKKIFDGLSPADQKIIQDAAKEASAYQRKVNRDKSADDLQELRAAGMQVTEFSAAEQAKLREKLKPVVEKHGAALGSTLTDIQAELAKLRK